MLKIILIVIGVLVVLGIIGGFAAFYFTRGVVKAGDEFVNHLIAHENEVAYNSMYTKAKEVVNLEDFNKIVETLLSPQVTNQYTWTTRTVSNKNGVQKGNLATILTLANGEKRSFELELVKEGGVWKVTLLEVRRI